MISKLPSQILVVDKNTSLPDGLIVVNAFGFGGANGMVILRPYKTKVETLNNLPYRLVHVSGRTEDGIKSVLQDVIKNRQDAEYLSLYDNIYGTPIDNHNFRGYAILSEKSQYEIQQCSSKRRPIWFVYSGFGSQWLGMGKELMEIEVFRDTIKKCAKVLKPYGVNLEEIIQRGNDKFFDNVCNIFPAIIAISVSLTNILASLNIKPDGFVGHSLGEVGCAYADDLITPEQATLLAFARAYAATNSNLPLGAMAAVGLSLEECSKILPKDIFIACENSEDSVTISGTQENIKMFLDDLKSKGIFNRLIDNANHPLHSPLLKPAGPKMYEIAKQALPDSKPRSQKWISSSFAEEDWNCDEAKENSAEYHLHNYMNRVNFKQVLKYIPQDAIVIEVAPRGLLQGIVKRSLGSNATVMPLLKPGENNLQSLLTNLGRLYNSGAPINLKKLYKDFKFPVSVTTPMISSLIKWDHRMKWHSLRYNPSSTYGCRIELDLNEKEFEYLEGHVADGRVILPAAGYMAFAKMLETTHNKLPVVFENVKTLRPILLLKDEVTTIVINICKSTGHFEICLHENEQDVLSSGEISVARNVEKQFLTYSVKSEPKLKISHDEFYNLMRLRGFEYNGVFKGVQNASGDTATLKWHKNWVAFIDSMIQYVLSIEATGHSLPTAFEKIIIDPIGHLNLVTSDIALIYEKYLGSAKCGGIEIRRIGVTNIKKRTVEIVPTLRKHSFVPFNDAVEQSYNYSLDVASQIVIENSIQDLNITIAELGSEEAIQILKSMIEKVNLKKTSFMELENLEQDIHIDLLITHEKLTNSNVQELVRKARFVFGVSDLTKLSNVDVVYSQKTNKGYSILIQAVKGLPENYTIIKTNNNNYNWVEELKKAAIKYTSNDSRIYLLNNDVNSGIVGLYNSSRLEQFSQNLRIFLINNPVETFSPKSALYIKQIKKDLTVNILRASWGTYRRLPLQDIETKLVNEAHLLKDMKGVRWITKNGKGNVKVSFSSLSKWDSLIVNDKAGLDSEEDQYLGMEYSGIDENGKRVMGVIKGGAISSTLTSHPELTWMVPNEMSYEQAATVPLAYTLSYYSLCVQNAFSPKDSILIFNSSSSVSLAAAVLALNAKLSVFLVANTEERKELKKILPNIKDSNIFDLDSSFIYQAVMRSTEGAGVNIIFNCNSIEMIKETKKCLMKHGYFIEINNSFIQSLSIEDALDKNCCYNNVNISDIFQRDCETLEKVSSNIKELLKEKVIIPLNYKVFENNNIEEAIKHVEGNNFEKCLIKLSNKIEAYPRTTFDPMKSYIIVGGLGGFGFELAKWMVTRGAAKIVLNSRSDLHSGYQASVIQKWKCNNLAILTNNSDTSKLEGAKDLIYLAATLGPIGGIFNTAMQAHDEFLRTLSPEDFIAVAKPKIFVAQNLDKLTREMCPNLDYFVMFSSVAASIGNPLQANYAFVNSAMARLCENRKQDGLPGLCVEFGPMADVGILVRMKLNIQYLETERQKLSSLLNVLDQFLQQGEPVVTSCVYASESENDTNKKKTLIEMVVALFGIKNVDELEDSKTLLDFGMDSLLGFEIKHILSKEASIEINVNDVRNMTIEKLKQLSK